MLCYAYFNETVHTGVRELEFRKWSSQTEVQFSLVQFVRCEHAFSHRFVSASSPGPAPPTHVVFALRCVALRSRKNYTRQIGPHTCMYTHRPYIQLAQHVYVRTSLTDLQVVLRCRANSEKRAESLSSRGSGTFRSPLLFPGLR